MIFLVYKIILNKLAKYNKYDLLHQAVQYVIDYLRIYQHYRDYLYKSLLVFNIDKVDNSYLYVVTNILRNIIINTSFLQRKKIIYCLNAVQLSIRKKTDLITIQVLENISQDNKDLIIQYVKRDLPRNNNIVFETCKNLGNNNLLIIYYKNYVMKLNIHNLVLHHIQITKKQHFWQFAKES